MRHGLGMSERGGVYRDLLGIEQTRRLIVEYPIWTIPDMNRMLVERATHRDALRDLAEELGGRWLAEEQRTYGLAAAERQQARNHALDRSVCLEELAFADLDEEVRTRLGEDGPRIVLAESVPGPFGSTVRTFNLPQHLFGAAGALPSKEEIEAARAELAMPEGIILHVGSHAFLYDRQGIRGRDQIRAEPGVGTEDLEDTPS